MQGAFEDLLVQHRRDDANFLVCTSVLTTSIRNWMDMQL